MISPDSAPVLVVEDDPKIALLLLDYLRAAGLPAQAIGDGLGAVQLARRIKPSVILLDLMLPGLDGLGVCKEVRAFSDVPIIMLTARVDEVDRLLGLDTGADDYVCKPFSPREVVARVKAQQRRAQRELVSAPLAWEIDDERMRVRWNGQTLALTILEFRLLRPMLSQPGRVFSRAQLLSSLHTDERDVSDRAIDSHVKNIRRKLQAVEPGFDGIRSVYGVGYSFEIAHPTIPAA